MPRKKERISPNPGKPDRKKTQTKITFTSILSAA